MESLENFDVRLDVNDDNVIDLDHERTARAARKQQSDKHTNLHEVSCENGVCVVDWKPRRPAA